MDERTRLREGRGVASSNAEGAWLGTRPLGSGDGGAPRRPRTPRAGEPIAGNPPELIDGWFGPVTAAGVNQSLA
jgi:hypothetical protein